MARLLVRASSNRYIYGTNAIVSGFPFSIVCRSRFTSLGAAAHVLGGVFKNDGGTDIAHYMVYDNRIGQQEFHVTSTDNNNWVDSGHVTGAITTGTWNAMVGMFASATSRTCFLNGTTSSTNTTSRNFSSVDTFSVGAYVNGSGGFGDHFDGDIADFALLNIIPTAGQMNSYYKGFTPRAIWPMSQIVEYWDFLGNITNEPGRKQGLVLTPNGTPAKSAHPVVIYPTPSQIRRFTTEAAPVVSDFGPRLRMMRGFGR